MWGGFFQFKITKVNLNVTLFIFTSPKKQTAFQLFNCQCHDPTVSPILVAILLVIGGICHKISGALSLFSCLPGHRTEQFNLTHIVRFYTVHTIHLSVSPSSPLLLYM